MTGYLRALLKVMILTIILLILSGVSANLLPVNEGTATAAPPIGLVLAVFFFQSLALAIPVLWSRWNGWRLAVAIFTIYFGTVTALTQIESIIYLDDKMPGDLVAGLFAMGFFVAAVFSPICVWVLGKWKTSEAEVEPRSPDFNLGRWGWRIAAAAAVFLGLYYLFGYYVAWQDPALREYYGGTDPGSFLAQMTGIAQSTPWMIPLQFLRGLIYVGLGLLVIYSMQGPWWRAGLALSIIFAAPAVYLLFPNPLMPNFPRLTHFIETLPYQFLFGWFLAWFLSGRRANTDTAHLQAG